jgi:hypothetical protein
VIGHEFSHILNGDMRLNIRLIGLLNGILLLGLIGLRILAFGGGGRGSKRDNGAAPILVIAFAMMVLGFVGQLFAGLIKAAVSRQREWLADASSVQFTRQTTGLAGALKKIAGLPTGSALNNMHGAREVSHMLFGEGGKSFSQLYATHPPLIERITALEPDFRPEQVEQLSAHWQADPPDGLTEDAQRGLIESTVPSAAVPSAAVPSAAVPPAAVPPGPAAPAGVDAAAVSARVATMTPADLAHAAELSALIPARFRQLASQGSTAVGLALAMMLDAEPDLHARQLALIADRLGDRQAAAADALAGELATLAIQLRLPVASLAAPLITARPRAVLDALVATLDELARSDGTITLFEYCLTRLVAGYVRDAGDPSGRSKPGRTRVARVQSSAHTLLAALAAAGNDDPAAAGRAFRAAADRLGAGPAPSYQPPADTWQALDDGWSALDALDPRHKQRLVEAMVVAVRDDGVLTLHEAELLRTACALLHCPMPGFVA